MGFDKALRELPGGKTINFLLEGRTMNLLFSELQLEEDAIDRDILLSLGVYLLKPALFMQGFVVERSDGMVRVVPVKRAPGETEEDQVFQGKLEDGKPDA